METLYWEIDDFTANSFKLFSEGRKIYSQKLSLKDVENKVGKKLRVCPKDENPHFIVSAKVEESGRKFLDMRRGLRGNVYRCYILAENNY